MENNNSDWLDNIEKSIIDHIGNDPLLKKCIKKPENRKNQPPDKTNKYVYMAQQIVKNDSLPKTVFSLDQKLYYIYKDGFWTIIDDIELLNIINTGFSDFNELAVRQKEEILKNYKIINFIKENQFNNSKLLNMKNGMLDPYTGIRHPHKAEYYSTNQIGYDYINDHQCPIWIKTINEIFEYDQERIGLLQEFYGYCLTAENNQKKALLLIGDTNTGKSTVLDMLKYMLGDVNVSTVELKDFENPQLTPMMVNKLVNIDFDVNKDAQKYESGFRKITSMEPITSNQKFQKAFNFIPICKIVMAANTFPRIQDYSSAFYNRLLVIPMNRKFSDKERIIGLTDILKEEISGILNWCIEGLIRFKKRGKFKEYGFIKEAVQQLEDDNNPVNNFLNDHIEIHVGYQAEKGEIFRKYREWCEVNKHGVLPHNIFSNVLFKKFIGSTFKDAKDPNTHKRVWKNLKYVEYKEIENKQEIAWKD